MRFFEKPKKTEEEIEITAHPSEEIAKILSMYREGEIGLTTSQRYVHQILRPFLDQYAGLRFEIDTLKQEVTLLKVQNHYKYGIDKDLQELSVMEELGQLTFNTVKEKNNDRS